MWRRGLAAGLLAVGLAMAQGGLTLQQLTQLIQSSVKLKQSDKEVASYLRKQKLSFALTDVAIEELQGMGAGPQTVAALRELQKASRGLPPPPKVSEVAQPAKPVEPPPSPEEQKRIIEQARANALSYTKRLPDFICLQLTRRYVDPTGLELDWRKYDEIKARLTYFEQKEDYKVISVNEQLTTRSFESLGGTTSQGEFGSMLAELFAPETAAEFEWDHHSVLRDRKVYVFRTHVPKSRSQWHISFQRQREVIAGYHGLVYIDKDNLSVLRLSLVTDELPSDFPITEARTALDYGYAKIADRDYLLPLHATVRLRESKFLTRNEVEFRLYRKFSTEATITFDDEAKGVQPEETKPPAEPQN
ncbi:MAG TPA: hypothetical protein VFA54_12220 [Bryobacterales bacterium]|nr:hypothetical protein [Bryobacterales bacterium]